MAKRVEMDERVTLASQMQHDMGPVVLIVQFKVAPEESQQFLEVWGRDAAFMKNQPGFVSTQLHRGIGGSCVFVNYAVWESVAHFRRAFTSPEFQARVQGFPPSVVASSHIFQTVDVAGIC